LISDVSVAAILRNIDIEGLIAQGAPRDEYDTEAKVILQRLLASECLSVNLTVAILGQVWKKYFGPFTPTQLALRQQDFERTARRIIEAAGSRST